MSANLSGGIADFDLEKTPVTGAIRLVENGANVLVCMSETRSAKSPDAGGMYETEIKSVLALAGQLGKETSAALMPQILAAPPAWDIRGYADGSAALAIESATGGGNAVQLLTSSANPRDLVDCCLGGLYAGPRLVRSAAAAPLLASSSFNQDSLVMFMQGESGVALQDLGAGDDGLVLAPQAGVLWVLSKGPGLGSSPIDGVFPGDLRFQQFTAAQGNASNPQPAFQGAEPVPVFSGERFFQVDADFIGGVVLLLASVENFGKEGRTPGEPRLALFDPRSGKALTIPWPDGYPQAGVWMASPTVLATAGGFYFAFVEYQGKQVAGIRHGLIPQPSPTAGWIRSGG
jgi:hypothetical protein